MSVGNTEQQYGWVSRYIHWLMAFVAIGMYFLGDYIVDLDYYDTWYHDGREIHKSIGILLGILLVFRVIWVNIQAKPLPLGDNTKLMLLLAKLAHIALYVSLFVLIVSGYLISTADAKGISVFGWFEVPALLGKDGARGDLAGEVHEIAGLVLMFLAFSHAAAALYHHFKVKDRTLLRMIKGK